MPTRNRILYSFSHTSFHDTSTWIRRELNIQVLQSPPSPILPCRMSLRFLSVRPATVVRGLLPVQIPSTAWYSLMSNPETSPWPSSPGLKWCFHGLREDHFRESLWEVAWIWSFERNWDSIPDTVFSASMRSICLEADMSATNTLDFEGRILWANPDVRLPWYFQHDSLLHGKRAVSSPLYFPPKCLMDLNRGAPLRVESRTNWKDYCSLPWKFCIPQNWVWSLCAAKYFFPIWY